MVLRDSTIEKQLPRWILKYSKYLSYPLPLYATQIINLSLKLMISANHDKVEGVSANNEIHIKEIVSLF